MPLHHGLARVLRAGEPQVVFRGIRKQRLELPEPSNLCLAQVHRPIAAMTFREVHLTTVAGPEKPYEFVIELDGPPLQSHAPICKVSTVLSVPASLEPAFDFSKSESRSVSEPGSYGDGVRGVFLRMAVNETGAALQACRQFYNGQ